MGLPPDLIGVLSRAARDLVRSRLRPLDDGANLIRDDGTGPIRSLDGLSKFVTAPAFSVSHRNPTSFVIVLDARVDSISALRTPRRCHSPDPRAT